MGQTAEELRGQIEETRQDLSRDVDAIGDKVSPGRVARRQVDRTKGTVSRLRDVVMGAASSGASTVADAGGSAQSGIAAAPDAAVRKAQGSPLAAGVVAFAVGWVVAGALPATRAEKDAASTVKDKAADLQEPLKEQAQEVGAQLKEQLQGQAQEAASATQESVRSAAQTIQEQAQSSRDAVTEQARESADRVREEAPGQSGPS
jgi:gas vesicle protein